MVVGIGFPRPVHLDRTGGLAAGGVAQVRRDAAILSLEFLDRVERRVAGEEANSRVQSAAREQHQRKAGTGLLIVDAHGSFFVKLATSLLGWLLSNYARHGGRCGCCSRLQYGASGRT